MKKVFTQLLTAVILMTASNIFAQIDTPAPSPFCKIEQKVGLTNVTLEYSRPGVKGRELFVDVEAFGKIWRTGANASTKITFSDDVTLEGHKVPAGTYAIYSIPDPVNWTIMLYKDLTLGGNVSKYNKEEEFLRFKVKGHTRTNFVESFKIDIDDLKDNSATLSLKWGNYYVPFKLGVSYREKVMKQIEKAIAGTTRSEYYSAAKFYFDENKDLGKAYEWVKIANQKGERYWQLRLQARIEAKLGMKDKAKMSIQKSSALAKSAGNDGYAKANKKIEAGF